MYIVRIGIRLQIRSPRNHKIIAVTFQSYWRVGVCVQSRFLLRLVEEMEPDGVVHLEAREMDVEVV